MRSADAWDDVADEYECRVQPFTEQFASPLLDACAVDGAPQTFVDVACGSGAVALAAAARGARVTACDHSQAMLDRLAARARAESVQLDALVACDGEAPPREWAGMFDCAASGFGVIFFPDADAGVAAMLRCVRPGGRVAISAWGSADVTPAFQVIPAAVSSVLADRLDARPRRLGARLGGADVPSRLRALFMDAGATAVRVDGPITRTLVVASAREYWLRFALGSPGTREMLAEAERIGGAQAVLAIEQAALADLRARFGDGEVRLDASAYVASGASPG